MKNYKRNRGNVQHPRIIFNFMGNQMDVSEKFANRIICAVWGIIITFGGAQLIKAIAEVLK